MLGSRRDSRNTFDNSTDDGNVESEIVNDQPGPSGISTKTLKVFVNCFVKNLSYDRVLFSFFPKFIVRRLNRNWKSLLIK